MTEHQPSSGDFNREDHDAMSDGPVCEQCGADLRSGTRFCSSLCWGEWQREGPSKPMTFEEMVTDMEGVFARVQSYDEEETS